MNSTPALQQFVGAYLNQDWPDDYSDQWAALEDFVTQESEATPLLPREIAWLLATHPSEEAVKRYLEHDLGTGYAADWDGGTYRGWLTEVAERVRAATT